MAYHKILSQSKLSRKRLIENFKKIKPDVKDIEPIIESYLKIGKEYGVRGDIAFAQAIVETGWFEFKNTAVTREQNNFCGLGVLSKGMTGHSFSTIEEGVTAHIQHLYAYATECQMSQPIVDPRFKYVKRGVAPYWKDLDGKWATNQMYSETILSVYKRLS